MYTVGNKIFKNYKSQQHKSTTLTSPFSTINSDTKDMT